MNFNIKETGREIKFEDLSGGDRLVLQTRNSTYQFTVTNVAKRQGFLTGGSLGRVAVPAELSATSVLSTGTRLKFYIESSTAEMFLHTSAITYLDVLRQRDLSLINMATLRLPLQKTELTH